MRGMRTISRVERRLKGVLGKMRGSWGCEFLGAVQEEDGGFVWGTALETRVAVEFVVGGRSGAELRVRLLELLSARDVLGSMGHTLSPFKTDYRDGIVGGVCPAMARSIWRAGLQPECVFALTTTHLLHRQY